MRPRKNSLKFGSCAKLSPRYCGPFEVLEMIRLVSYIVSFPANTRDHNFFHVSFLKKYLHDPNYVIKVEPKGEFQTEPLCILDMKVTMPQNCAIR